MSVKLSRLVTERLTERLAPEDWRLHEFVADDEAAFTREAGSGVVFRFGVNLAGRGGDVTLSSTVGVQHVDVARLEGRFYGHDGDVCQVGASMINLVYDAGVPSQERLFRWWVPSPERVDAAVEQVVSDLAAYGEPFLAQNLTLPQVIETLRRSPKSQAEYGTLAVCMAMLGDMAGARDALARFGEQDHRLFSAEATEQFIRSFTEQFDVGP